MYAIIADGGRQYKVEEGQELELDYREVPPGEHRLQWSAEGLASGVYLCRMTARGFSQTIKLLYQK